MMEQDKLKGKKVLFISAKFFDYHNQMQRKLEELGAEVTYFDERPANTTFVKLGIRFAPNLLKSTINKYYQNIYNEVKNKEYDYFFLVKGETIPLSFLENISKTFPNIKKVFMMWDSVANYTRVLDKVVYFDKIFSFDQNDCQQYGFQFRPLFYNEKYLSLQNSNPKIDLSFVGTVHSDRLNILEEIKQNFPDKKYDYFLYLQSPLVFRIKKITNPIFKKKKKEDFEFNSLSGAEVLQRIENSKIIIDIEHPGQTGLTMRTIEMLGAHKKIITTNQTIKNYDFYRSENICVINRKNIEIDEAFFTTQFQPLSDEIMYKYSLTGFIEEIFTI
ncbi:MAG: lipopolysaccharide biosynthesis protein [Culicoidibacterales bacterium]